MTARTGTTEKPWSAACERNREPILAVLREHLTGCRSVLEIGSGTGQHAVHFARHMPWLTWQASDRREHLAGIQAWLDEAGLANTPPALELDVSESWPAQRHDAVFSANTLHIMAWPEVERLFAHLPDVLADDGVVIVYGPFHVGGAATSDSNAAFDASLRARAAHMGVRDLEAVNALAASAGLGGLQQHLLPANNRCLAWRRLQRKAET